ncbi:MAG: peptide ABC transporter substrate-binding protein [Anaerolineae bacterium]|nr:MAG: peptide ABC transporter substrate-binding protein [Anaerolineae bacterium]
MRNITRVVLLVLLASMLVGAFGISGAQEAKVLYVANIGQDDIPHLDPGLAEDVASIQILEATYVGLTTLNEVTVTVEPGIATEWSVSDDGLVYTFSLMQNVPWVVYNTDSGAVEEVKDADGNVRYVTANDFVYGIKRTLDPNTAGPYAYVLAPWIVGGAEYNGGSGSADDVAVAALDDYTLQITAPKATPFLANIYGMWMALAQPQWVIDEMGDAWADEGTFQSYGPYALKEWAHDESLTLIKNPFWPGTDYVGQAKIDEIVFLLLEQSAKLAEYEAGNLDFMDDLPTADLDRIRVEYPNEFTVSPSSCSYGYGFNTEKEPVNDARVRRALSMAIDRQAITDNILKAGQIPAGFYMLPNLTAAPSQEDYPDLAIKYDPEAAKAELQAYLDEKGISVDELPPITYMTNETDLHKSIIEAIQNMWRETLGVEVQITFQEFGVFLDTRKNDAPQIFRYGWCYDYPDAHNFSGELFRSDSTQNDPNWVNPEYDALVDQALTENDPDVRRELYAQAEYLLVNQDAAMAPIYYYVETQLTKPNVERTLSVIGRERFEKWDIK